MKDKPLTKRQEKIEAGRVADVRFAEAAATLANRLCGSWADYAKQCLPARKWVRSGDGMWRSVPR